jgi:prevent-host-death family protein
MSTQAALSHIPAGEFKAKCLKLLDQVYQQRFQVVITKRGKPVARLVPVTDEMSDIFGRMKGTVEILGDIVGPTGEVWNADREAGDV